jgi:hypothetical protein
MAAANTERLDDAPHPLAPRPGGEPDTDGGDRDRAAREAAAAVVAELVRRGDLPSSADRRDGQPGVYVR